MQAYPQSVKDAFAPLTLMTRRFVLAYVGEARGNGTLACKIAGIEGTYAVRASRASTMLQDSQVREAIDAWMQAYGMSAAELTWGIADLIKANLGPFVEWQADGSLLVKVPDEDTWEAHKHWIREIETDPATGKVTRLVLHNSMEARREYAKIMKLYTDAPIFVFTQQVQKMPDDVLLKQLAEARSEETRMLGLPAGGPVAEVVAPEAKKTA